MINTIYQKFWDAAEVGDTTSINNLCFQIEDINKANPKGWNAIILSAFNHHKEVVKILLKHGADINSVNANGTTVFMYAKTKVLENNDFEFLDYLIECGADINRKDFKNNWTVLDYAKKLNNLNLINYLISKGAK